MKNEDKYLVQINFDFNDVNTKNDDIIKRYYKRDERGRIVNCSTVYARKCYDIWKKGYYKYYKKDERELILFCSLFCADNRDDFFKCLDEIDMEDDAKLDFVKSVFESSN